MQSSETKLFLIVQYAIITGGRVFPSGSAEETVTARCKVPQLAGNQGLDVGLTRRLFLGIAF